MVSLDQRFFDYLTRRRLLSDLRKAFRRVCWVGARPDLPSQTPVIAYANHHNFYDGHLLWLVVDRLLGRPPALWMADWDRFPFFAPSGAQPFPPDDARRRSATLRRTARRFRQTPETMLIYFPEGRLHAPEDGVLPFDTQAFSNLDRLFPEKRWWPVAVYVTWRGEARPTAFLTAGEPHATSHGQERATLEDLLSTLRTKYPDDAHVLLEGRSGPSERWDFSFLAPFFKRYL